MFTIGNVEGLTQEEQQMLNDLMAEYKYHYDKNRLKDKYYEGHITLGDVNLGIALPSTLSSLKVGCEWGGKCVDVLAARSMFDGFVDSNGENNPEVRQITDDNRLISAYGKACRDELKYGCTFATLAKRKDGNCSIKFHSPMTAAGLWDGVNNRLKCGFAIIDTAPSDQKGKSYKPSLINFYTENDVIVLTRNGTKFTAERLPHKMGRPLMEALIWNPTSKKPFGRSRLKAPIRSLIDAYIRTMANAAIALEFDTTPQKYLLGVTDDQFEAISNDKFQRYIGSILAATANPDTGQNPVFGQLAQGSLTPHIDMLKMTATQFSAATGLSIADTGVVNDANPTSSEAIIAQTQTLILLAEQLNKSNGDSLKEIAKMAYAIQRDITLEEVNGSELDIVPHFKNPAMPSVAATSDAAVKIASVREGFADTDVFMEMIGFDQADIRRIKAQEQRARGQAVLRSISEEENE